MKNTMDFYEIEEMVLNTYTENFDENDTNEQVKSWLEDNVPALKIKVDNSKMRVVIENAEELLDKDFVWDGDQWVIKDEE